MLMVRQADPSVQKGIIVAETGKIIVVLVFVCGLLTGGILYGLLTPGPVLPAKHPVFSKNAPKPIGPYSQAMDTGSFMYLSGQIGIDPVTGNLSGNTESQTKQAMENLHAVLQESGLGFEDVVQTRIYLTNMSDWNTVNGIYGSYFTGNFPARATVQVAGLPKGASVEIEMTALKR